VNYVCGYGWKVGIVLRTRRSRTQYVLLIIDLSCRDKRFRPVLFTVVSPNSLRFPLPAFSENRRSADGEGFFRSSRLWMVVSGDGHSPFPQVRKPSGTERENTSATEPYPIASDFNELLVDIVAALLLAG